ncbi:hypothetical protein K523DRAFT_83470 [Schizophyllum commune Tattone D]|nr:hypothetical protein K523DRAFT_83470 [Schizophyllum commune Tattone D]
MCFLRMLLTVTGSLSRVAGVLSVVDLVSFEGAVFVRHGASSRVAPSIKTDCRLQTDSFGTLNISPRSGRSTSPPQGARGRCCISSRRDPCTRNL